MSDIFIRKANESDLEDILTLLNAPQADNGKVMELRDASTVYQSILEDSNYFQIIASTEEEIIAMVTLVIIMQMSHEGSTSALVTDLIVAETADKAAVATDLMRYVMALADEYGCYKTIVSNDYQQDLIETSCRELGLEKTGLTFSV